MPSFIAVPSADTDANDNITDESNVEYSSTGDFRGVLLSSTAYTVYALSAAHEVTTLANTGNANVPEAFTVNDWALSDPDDATMDIVIFSIPTNGEGGILQYKVGHDGTWETLHNTAVPGTYRATGFPLAVGGLLQTGDVVQIRVNKGTGLVGPDSDYKIGQTLPMDPRGFRGHTVGVDLGTVINATNERIVAPYGSDSNDGLTPETAMLTPEAALAVNQVTTVKMRAGLYKDPFQTNISGLTIQGYGEEVPTIAGVESITGWTQCSAADAGVLGSQLGVANSPIWKAQLPFTAILDTQDITIMNLKEARNRAFISQDQDTYNDPFTSDNIFEFHVADNWIYDTSDGNNRVIGIYDPDVINSTRYPNDAALVGKGVYLWVNPNIVRYVTIISADIANNTVMVDSGDVSSHYIEQDPTSSIETERYAILNVPANMNPGSYITEDDGTTATIYYYPRDVRNLEVAMEYSTRDNMIEIMGANNNCTFERVHFHGVAGNSFNGSGCGIYKATQRGLTFGLTVKNCRFTGFQHKDSQGQGLRVESTAEGTVEYNTFFDMSNCNAMFYNGVGSYDNRFSFNQSIRVSGSMSIYSTSRAVYSFNYIDHGTLQVHKNAVNSYYYGHGFAVWGNEYGPNTAKYMTWQEMSSVLVGFNLMHHNNILSTDRRKIADQNTRRVYQTNLNGNGEVIELHTEASLSISRYWADPNAGQGLVGTNIQIRNAAGDYQDANISAVAVDPNDSTRYIITVSDNFPPTFVNAGLQSVDAILDYWNGNGTDLLVVNNTLLPDLNLTSTGAAISVTNGQSSMMRTVDNNIADGISDVDSFEAARLVSYKSNVSTRESGTGQTNADIGSDNHLTTPEAIFNDPSAGDFSPLAGSRYLTTPGIDRSAEVAAHVNGWFWAPDITKDYKFQTIDWSVNPIGADSALPFYRGVIAEFYALSTFGEDNATITMDTRNGGTTLHVGLWPSSVVPTEAEIIAGTGAVQSFDVTSVTDQTHTFNFDSLTAGTEYVFYSVLEDASGNYSLTGTAFTTIAAAPELHPDPGVDDPALWTALGGMTVTGGHITMPPGSNGNIVRPNTSILIPVTAGETYRHSFEVTNVRAEGRFRTYNYYVDGTGTTVDLEDKGFDNTSGTIVPGVYNYTETVPAGVTHIRPGFNPIGATLDIDIDNISIKLLS